ncbi:Brefeldin A-inhibited guanine nucleotide-exchange protein 2, partial [Dinochytrium kinnereticum]
MADLIKSCLDKLLVETSGSSYGSSKPIKELRESITAAMEQLSEEKDKVLSKGGNPNTDICADQFYTPFRLSTAPTLPPKIRETSLDALQKLIAHKILRGALPLSSPPLSGSIPTASPSTNLGSGGGLTGLVAAAMRGKPAAQGDGVGGGHDFGGLDASSPTGVGSRQGSELSLGGVCTAFTGSPQDDTVQLQVIKVLLTSITSTACEVHGVSLLKVIQTCFNIHVHSKSHINQVTAKASLTQMVNLIVSRMERYSEVLARSGGMVDGGDGLRRGVGKGGEENGEKSGVKSGEENGEKSEVKSGEENGEKSEVKSGEESLDKVVEESPQKSEEESVVVVDNVETSSTNETLADAEKDSTTSQKEPISSVEDEASSSQDPDLSSTSSAQPTSLPPLPPQTTTQIPIEAPTPNPYDPTIAYYNELLRKDVFLIFRLLCRLSTQSDSTTPTPNLPLASTPAPTLPSDDLSPTTVKARIVALELILSILNNGGPVLMGDELFVEVIRVHLCAGVMRNSFTMNPLLFELALSIFLMLVGCFRARLKTEVEVLLNTVYLHILEMNNSTYKQKSLVLQSLLKICENPQTLVDLYLNYDCDLSAVSIFERIVSVCARVAQGKESTVAAPPMTLMGYAGLDGRAEVGRAQDRRLRLRGLCCLVAIVNSLVEWSGEGVAGKGKLHVVDTPGDTPVVGEAAAGSPVPSGGGLLGVPAKSANASMEMMTKSFLDALAPGAQSSVVVNNRKPLHSVTMQSSLYSSASNSQDPLSISHPSLPSLLSSSTDTATAEEIVTRKTQLRQGLKLFDQKPLKGIKFLVENGFVEDTDESIAKFLMTTQGLNKAAVGDYLGDGDARCVRVMHAFVDLMEFGGVEFVPALRGFLQGFRLPGEAQKIDRIMEKFADRYCETNPGIFAKADTAYVLAFSVIMLNTDQHNPDIKNRMDRSAFVINNRGINDNADLPEAFLGGIFDEIQKNEIIMEEEHAGQFARLAIGWGAGNLSERQRLDLYKKEAAHIQKKSAQLIKSATSNRTTTTPFRTATLPDLARPMFASASWALMAVFSLLFESAVDDVEEDSTELGKEPKIYDLCLQGFAGSVRIAAVFGLETERDAFVTSLSRLTGLSHLGEMRWKNVKVIKTLVALANTLGEYLESSWVHILKIISLMERLQLIGNKAN